MRTLKKTLCLVLVLVMMVGLLAVGASATVTTFDDYTDKDAIQHPEAVKVLTKLKVLEGDDKDAFRGSDNLTRAESTAFFTRLCAQTGAGRSSFTDMAAAEWAQPYVAFCQGSKIVAGFGDGTFRPLEPVTYIQWAKMCLVVAGYDPIKEGLADDAAWEVNTLKLVATLDLAADIPNPNWNGPITRDDAAQMGFNTLKQTMVEYTNGTNIKVNTPDGTYVEVNGGWWRSDVENNDYCYSRDEWGDHVYDDEGYMQVCEYYFPLLKMYAHREGAFALYYNHWYWGDNRKDANWTAAKNIATELADTIMATYTTGATGVTGKKLYEDGKTNANRPTALDVFENGIYVGNGISANRLNTQSVLGGYGGATVLLVDTDEEGSDSPDYGIADELIVEYPILAKITKVTEATAKKDRFVNVQAYLNNAGATKSVNFEWTTNSYALGDYVLLYPHAPMRTVELLDGEIKGINEWTKEDFQAPGAIVSSKLADTASGTLSKVTVAAGEIVIAATVGGVNYFVGANADLGPDGLVVSTNKDNYNVATGTGETLYLSNGYVIGLVPDAIAYSNYIIVLGRDPKDAGEWSPLTNSTSYRAGYARQDGTTAVEYVTGANETNYDQAMPVLYGWGTASPAGTGTAFKQPNVTVMATVNYIAPGVATLAYGGELGGQDIIADAKTNFIVRGKNGVISTFTGVSKLPGYSAGSGEEILISALVPKKGTAGAHAAAIFIDLQGAETIGTTDDMIYLTSTVPSAKSGEGRYQVFEYTGVYNGELNTVKSENHFAEEYDAYWGVLAIPTYDSNRYVLDIYPATFWPELVGYNGTWVDNIASSDGTLVVSLVNDPDDPTDDEFGEVFTLAPDCKVYVYDANEFGSDALKVCEPADIEGEFGFIATIHSSFFNLSVKTIYLYIPADSSANRGSDYSLFDFEDVLESLYD